MNLEVLIHQLNVIIICINQKIFQIKFQHYIQQTDLLFIQILKSQLLRKINNKIIVVIQVK